LQTCVNSETGHKIFQVPVQNITPYKSGISFLKGQAMKGFDKLDIDSKSIVLHYNGRMIASVIYYNYRATLFAFGNLLIEEYYDTEIKEISRICTAQDQDLKKYLEKIDITDLIK
jgi:hypothetical protein